jgi:hypothetical protein
MLVLFFWMKDHAFLNKSHILFTIRFCVGSRTISHED